MGGHAEGLSVQQETKPVLLIWFRLRHRLQEGPRDESHGVGCGSRASVAREAAVRLSEPGGYTVPRVRLGRVADVDDAPGAPGPAAAWRRSTSGPNRSEDRQDEEATPGKHHL